MQKQSAILFSLMIVTQGLANASAPGSSILKQNTIVPKSDSSISLEESWAIEKYVPFQSLKYEIGFDDQTGAGDAHTLRLDIKSLEELRSFSKSKQISQELLSASQAESINQGAYQAHLELMQRALFFEHMQLIVQREKKLAENLNQSSKFLGLSDAKVKDIIDDIKRLYRIERDGGSVRAFAEESEVASELRSLAQVLTTSVDQFLEKVEGLNKAHEPLELKRRRLELDLDSLDQRVGWADDRKFLSHLEIRQNFENNESVYRINFNIPWLRFDREQFARDKVLHRVKEEDFARRQQESQMALNQQLIKLRGLRAQVKSTVERLDRTLKLDGRLKGVKDIELERVLGDFTFDLQSSLLTLSFDFYSEYLSYLYERGSFAELRGVNFLDPNWSQIEVQKQ